MAAVGRLFVPGNPGFLFVDQFYPSLRDGPEQFLEISNWRGFMQVVLLTKAQDFLV